MDTVTQYMNSLMKEPPKWTEPFRQYASEHHVPIIDELSLNVVLQYLRLSKPKKILEIGTAIGYSALRMNDVCPEALIVTIEKNEHMYNISQQNIIALGKQEKIKVLYGDAIDVIASFSKDKRFDFVFIDAAKSKYNEYFDLIDPLLEVNGFLIADNILFRNYVIEPELIEAKRFKKLAEKLHLFNEQMSKRANYHSLIIPVGDGLLCSIKLSEK